MPHKNRQTRNLEYVLFTVQNCGNREIRNQYIRLEFSQGITILDYSYDPKPEKKMGFQPNNHGLEEHERGYNI